LGIDRGFAIEGKAPAGFQVTTEALFSILSNRPGQSSNDYPNGGKW
jgi:hypothetical protein